MATEKVKESAYISVQLSDWLGEYADKTGASKSSIIAVALQQLRESKNGNK